jgi:hypothetical protein
MGRNGTSGRFRMRRGHVGRVGVNAFLHRPGSAGCAGCQLKSNSQAGENVFLSAANWTQDELSLDGLSNRWET